MAAGTHAVRVALASNLGLSGCLQGLILNLGHRTESSQQLALALARSLLFGGQQSTDANGTRSGQQKNVDQQTTGSETLVDMEALLSSLLTMLDQHGDAISRAAVCLIADVAVQQPRHVLPSLFSRLEREPTPVEPDAANTAQALIVDTEEENRKLAQDGEAHRARPEWQLCPAKHPGSN